MVAFMRKADKPEDTLVVVVNFANVEQEFTLGAPYEGKYQEILNTDDERYGGLGRVNGEAISVMEEEADGRPYSFTMKSAPLSASIFAYVPYTEQEKQQIARKKAILKAEADAKAAQQRAEDAREEAAKAREEAEEAKRLVEEALEREKEAQKRAEEEMKQAQKELKRAEAMKKEEAEAKKPVSNKRRHAPRAGLL